MTMFQNLRRMMQSPTDTLKVRCETCGHRGYWNRREAFNTFGEDAAPYDIRRRLKCTECKRPTELAVWI